MADTDISSQSPPARTHSLLSETQALDWLRTRGRVTMSAAELGRCWGGWPRKRVGRRLQAWAKAGLIKRRDDIVTVADGGTKTIATDGTDTGTTSGTSGGTKSDLSHGTNGGTDTALVPVRPRKVARQATSASRVIERALAVPAEAALPPVVTASGPVSEPTTVTDPTRVTILPPARSTAPWIRAVLILVAIGIGALALIINAQLGWWFGTTPLASWTFAGLAVGADLLAMILPSVAVALWHAHHRLLAFGAWSTWPLVTALTVLTSLGFIELNTGDVAANRQSILATATSLATQRDDRIAAARTAAETAVSDRDAECKSGEGLRCRELRATVRSAEGKLSDALAAPVPPVVAINNADPQVTGALRLANWVGLGVKADDVRNVRLALMAILPNISGLLFAFSVGLARPVRHSR